MIYPNKNIAFEESILYKMLYILEYKNRKQIFIAELYSKLKLKYQNIDEFIYSIDVLYVLDLIEVDFEKKMIRYVERN